MAIYFPFPVYFSDVLKSPCLVMNGSYLRWQHPLFWKHYIAMVRLKIYLKNIYYLRMKKILVFGNRRNIAVVKWEELLMAGIHRFHSFLKNSVLRGCCLWICRDWIIKTGLRSKTWLGIHKKSTTLEVTSWILVKMMSIWAEPVLWFKLGLDLLTECYKSL